jgi:hypothetical protein
MKNFLYLIAILIAIGLIGYFFFYKAQEQVTFENILSFDDCAVAGYPVTGSSPRQCRTPDGRTYAEEMPAPAITYKNATADHIVPENPFPGAVVGKEFMATGKARGVWFFEGSFPVTLLDKDGKVLFQTYATAEGEWMTTEFVSFKSQPIKVPVTYIGPATLVLQKDNPSDMREHDA